MYKRQSLHTDIVDLRPPGLLPRGPSNGWQPHRTGSAAGGTATSEGDCGWGRWSAVEV